MNGSAANGASPAGPNTSSAPSTFGSDLSTLGSGLQTGAQLYNIAQGLQSGKPVGEAGAALGAASLAAQHGYLGSASGSSGAINGLGAASGALQLYTGLKQGGVQGYGSAVDGALRAGQGVSALAGDSALSGALGSAAGALAVPLSLYNFASNWQSGNTGSDAMNGAETGATIGSVIPGIGTLIGGLAGGAVGALSSAFGGGRPDPETTSWNSLAQAQTQNPGANVMANLSPSQSYQSLAGLMDAKNNTPGHSSALELAFGRMGEGTLMSQMTGQINSAIASGKLAKTASPAQIYSSIVAPWLSSKNANVPNNAVISSDGSRNNGMVQNLLTQLISQWQSGALTGASQVGVGGQTIAGLPGYAGAPSQSASTGSGGSAVGQYTRGLKSY